MGTTQAPVSPAASQGPSDLPPPLRQQSAPRSTLSNVLLPLLPAFLREVGRSSGGKWAPLFLGRNDYADLPEQPKGPQET